MGTSDNLLLDGIVKEAQDKADAIMADAEKQVGHIEADAKSRLQDQLDKEAQAQTARLQHVRFKLDADMQGVKRKAALQEADQYYQAVMDQVEARFQAFARTEAFRPYLAQWIAEAAIGLDLKEARVATHPLAQADEAMLRQAEELVRKMTGAQVHLSLDDRPIRKIGVVLSSLDGKISFNNQVDVRLRRYDREIRTLIQGHTWKAE